MEHKQTDRSREDGTPPSTLNRLKVYIGEEGSTEDGAHVDELRGGRKEKLLVGRMKEWTGGQV